MESSETKKKHQSGPRVLLYVLNRNGLEEDELRATILSILDTKFAVNDVSVLWVSIFGKRPDRPHAFFTLSDDEIAREMAGQIINITLDEHEYNFEISEASGTDPKDGEDPLALYVQSVPTNVEKDELEVALKEFFGRIAPVKTIIFPKEWTRNADVIMLFEQADSAKMVLRGALYADFMGTTMKLSYARIKTPYLKQERKREVKTKPKRDYFIESLKK